MAALPAAGADRHVAGPSTPSFLRERAPQVRYSAQVLYQELRERGFAGSYQTVKRFVQPLRTAESAGRASDRARSRPPPGQQSQIDWGAARVHFRHQPVVLHLFVLTLGYSRRHYTEPTLNERVPQFLDAHERAFDHFGGHTREHLYDRPRTICSPDGQGGRDLERDVPELRALLGLRGAAVPAVSGADQGQGRVGREVPEAQLPRRPIVRRPQGRAASSGRSGTRRSPTCACTAPRTSRRSSASPTSSVHLLPRAARPGFKLEARFTRIVADDFLVSLDSNRYSVPFSLIGHTRRGRAARRPRSGSITAAGWWPTHAELPGRHGLVVLPEHGPGPRSAQRAAAASHQLRRRRSRASREAVAVEQRDLATYDALVAVGGER